MNSANTTAPEVNLNSGSGHTTEELANMLKNLRLSAMAEALMASTSDPKFQEMGFNDQLYELLATENSRRRTNTYLRRKKASNAVSSASQELIIERKASYHLTRTKIDYLMSCEWITNRTLILIVGKCGCGKSDLAAAIVDSACRQGLKALCVDFEKLIVDLVSTRKRTDSPDLYEKMKASYSKYDLLFIDDVCIENSIEGAAYVFKDLLELYRNGKSKCGLILASQLKPSKWYSRLGGTKETCDAVVDRVLSNYELISLDGRSHRSGRPNNNENDGTPADCSLNEESQNE